MTDLPERFWAKVDLHDPDGCWVWLAGNDNGYGKFHWDGRPWLAHRFVYHFLVEPLSPHREVLHRCSQTLCVNPEHLFTGSHRERMLRSETRQSSNLAKTVCREGHAFDERNTRLDAAGDRICRTCERERSRKGWRGETDFSSRTHGRPATYAAGCKCDACREAEREYRRSLRASRRPVRFAVQADKWRGVATPGVKVVELGPVDR